MASSKKKKKGTTPESRARAVSAGLSGSGAYQHGTWGGSQNSGGGGGSPGVVSRVFDILSRGNYAVAGAVKGSDNPKDPNGFDTKGALKGLLSGLSGTQKITFGDVLQSRGMKGPGAAIGGFGLDVLFDPLSYVGLGLAKRGIEGSGLGAKVLSKAVTGSDLAAGVTRTALESAPGSARTARAAELRVLGKPVLTSQKVGDALLAVTRPVADSKVGTLVGNTFRTGHGLPQTMRDVSRKQAGVGAQRFDKVLRDIQTTFSGTSKVQRKAISTAIARDTIETLDDTLRPLAEYAKNHLDLLRPDTGTTHKLFHVGDTADTKIHDLQGGLFGGVASDLEKSGRVVEKTTKLSSKQTKLFDDSELNVLGDVKNKSPFLSESDDIADVLANQWNRHFTQKSYDDFISEVETRFADDLKLPEVRQALDKTKRVFTPGTRENKEWVKAFDKIQGYWKMAVTAPNPAFHVRNLMGDTYLNFLDGVVNANAYRSAISALRGSEKISWKVGNRTLSGDDIIRLFEEQGLRSRFTQVENVIGGTSNKVIRKIGDVSNFREDMSRLAHFIDALQKEAKHGVSIEKATEAAAARVRKFNIDYGDLTAAERKIKRVIPFYTFARKALPVQLEMVFTRPGRVAVVPKAGSAIERLLGVRQEGDGPLPGIDEAVPPWMRDQFMISRGDNKVVTPDLPIDLLGQYANPVKGVLESLSPAISGPIETVTGKTLPYGLNQKDSLAKYILNQVPLGRQVGNVASQDEDARDKLLRYLLGPFSTKKVG